MRDGGREMRGDEAFDGRCGSQGGFPLAAPIRLNERSDFARLARPTAVSQSPVLLVSLQTGHHLDQLGSNNGDSFSVKLSLAYLLAAGLPYWLDTLQACQPLDWLPSKLYRSCCWQVRICWSRVGRRNGTESRTNGIWKRQAKV